MGDHADDTMNYDDEAGDHIVGDGGPQDCAIMDYIHGRRSQGDAYIDESEDAQLGRFGEAHAWAWIDDLICSNRLDAEVEFQWPTTEGLRISERIDLNRRDGDLLIRGIGHDSREVTLRIEVKSTRKYASAGTISFPRRCFDRCEADLLVGLGFHEDNSVSFQWHRTMRSVKSDHGHVDLGDFVIVRDGPGWDLQERLVRTFRER